MKFLLLVLAAVVASVSAITVNLPLYSRAADHAADGSTKFRLPVSRRTDPDSGDDISVTDWFSRSDNQVSQQPPRCLMYFRTTLLTSHNSGTRVFLSALLLRSCKSDGVQKKPHIRCFRRADTT